MDRQARIKKVEGSDNCSEHDGEDSEGEEKVSTFLKLIIFRIQYICKSILCGYSSVLTVIEKKGT